MPWMDMAHDAGARGDEQKQMAQMIEEEERRKQDERDEQARDAEALYRLFVSADSTILFRLWSDGTMEAALRDNRSCSWGPPVVLVEERVQ